MVTEFGRCRYKDNQMITLQELPETALPGQLPHSAEVGGWRATGGGIRGRRGICVGRGKKGEMPGTMWAEVEGCLKTPLCHVRGCSSHTLKTCSSSI
jgi:hypothetical protein